MDESKVFPGTTGMIKLLFAENRKMVSVKGAGFGGGFEYIGFEVLAH